MGFLSFAKTGGLEVFEVEGKVIDSSELTSNRKVFFQKIETNELPGQILYFPFKREITSPFYIRKEFCQKKMKDEVIEEENEKGEAIRISEQDYFYRSILYTDSLSKELMINKDEYEKLKK